MDCYHREEEDYYKKKGIIRAVAKGSDIITIGNSFRVTDISDTIYNKVSEILQNNFNPNTFNSILNREARAKITDINGDKKVDNKDILVYNATTEVGCFHLEWGTHDKEYLQSRIYNIDVEDSNAIISP